MVSLEKSRYWYRKIWSRKKSFGIGLRKFGLEKILENILISSHSHILISSHPHILILPNLFKTKGEKLGGELWEQEE